VPTPTHPSHSNATTTPRPSRLAPGHSGPLHTMSPNTSGGRIYPPGGHGVHAHERKPIPSPYACQSSRACHGRGPPCRVRLPGRPRGRSAVGTRSLRREHPRSSAQTPAHDQRCGCTGLRSRGSPRAAWQRIPPDPDPGLHGIERIHEHRSDRQRCIPISRRTRPLDTGHGGHGRSRLAITHRSKLISPAQHSTRTPVLPGRYAVEREVLEPRNWPGIFTVASQWRAVWAQAWPAWFITSRPAGRTPCR